MFLSVFPPDSGKLVFTCRQPSNGLRTLAGPRPAVLHVLQFKTAFGRFRSQCNRADSPDHRNGRFHGPGNLQLMRIIQTSITERRLVASGRNIPKGAVAACELAKPTFELDLVWLGLHVQSERDTPAMQINGSQVVGAVPDKVTKERC